MERDERTVRQRLVLCLDGTWNQQDSGTNVYHLSNLIREGEVTNDHGTWRQLVEYQAGVGTQALDRVTGGAFGIGLSKNVREAYDWLVEHYCDDDEIYVFGFSRGAFTARSLVGLINKCGLLRRGAPIPPDELWHAYQVLGRNVDPRTKMEPAANWWERIFGKPKPPFRELKELRRESWERSEPIELAAPSNCAEELLKQWSRRVPIHCVGVFETVGALGLNAFAIPWVRDHTAQFHDARLTSLVTNGFHALAIDEHRASFLHVPWFRETAAQLPDGKTVNGGRLEQRWFTGAHSNVGGGYEDDLLSQRPLAWLIEELKGLGLEFRPVASGDPDPASPPPVDRCRPLLARTKSALGLADQAPALRDSFKEFAGGIWQHFIRSKREYRRMAPPPELQNGKPARSLHETLDGSVLDLAAAEPAYDPPNLWRFRKDADASFPKPPPPHRYGEPGVKWWIALGVWLYLIGVAGWTLGGRLDAWRGPLCGVSWRWLAALAPFLALLVDWRESVLNHRTALEPEGMKAEKRLAWMDFYLGVRLGALFAAALGVVILVVKICGPWLRRDLALPTPEEVFFLRWLLALDGLWLLFQGAMAWNGGPMTDAGLSSIVNLQRAKSPAKVVQCLAKWAGGTTEKEQPLLTPVVRALWRDMLVFIPAYTLVLFASSWLALSLAEVHLFRVTPGHMSLGLLSCDRCVWLPALAGAILCALADYVEDWSELRFVRLFPEPPSRGAVAVASTATIVKFGLFSVGLLLTTAATLALALGPLCELVHGRPHTIGLIAALAAILLAGSITMNFLSARDADAKGAGGTKRA